MAELKVSGNFYTFGRRLEASRNRFNACLQKAMKNALALGVETGKDTIESSGTDKEWKSSWHGRTSSGRGRVDTGEMRDQFRGEVDNGKGETTGKLGWTKEQLEYFFYQDQGFTHNITGEEIAGMFALLEASEETWSLLRQEFSTCNSQFIRSI